jgi:uncharacterized protein (DUF2267 family)
VQRFLDDIEQAVILPRHVDASAAALATICTLTRRLSAGEAQDVLEALPLPLHGFLQPCERHGSAAGEDFGLEEFLRHVAEHLQISESDAERVALAVFSALRARLPAKEVEDVASQLPKALKRLWRAAIPGVAVPANGPPTTLTPPGGHFVLDEIERSGTLPSSISGAQAFSAVMCTLLVQVLPTDEAEHVAASLPTSVRTLVERCAQERERRPARLNLTEFALRVAARMKVGEWQAREIVEAVFAGVQRLMSQAERDAVARRLPHDMRALWIGSVSSLEAPSALDDDTRS